jgi:hypothetical protein
MLRGASVASGICGPPALDREFGTIDFLRCSIATGSIDYALNDGSVADEVCYWRDMTLVRHFFNLLFKREIRANYSFSPAKVRAGNRKEIARELRAEIVSIRS